MRGLSVVGTSVPRVDGVAKAKGEARYTDDIKLPMMLYGKFLRSPVAHARILNVDCSQANKVPGVKAIVTGQDLPVKFGIVPQKANEHPLAVDKVRYVGEPVAAVAAATRDAAEEAVQLIKVEYEELPVILDPIESMQSDVRIHEDREHNIDVVAEQQFGDVDQAFKTAYLVREDEFSMQMVNHAFLEPHSVLVQPDASGNLVVYSSTQIPHYLHRALSQALGVPMDKVRVAKVYVGGAFGGKAETLHHEIVASFLALKTGRPVKFTFAREEVFQTHRGRHPVITRVKIGVDKDGTLLALEYDTTLDGGAYSGWGTIVLYYMASLIHAPYIIPNVRFTGKRVFTNKPPMGAQRGLGGVQPRFAIESELDMVAHDLGMDPLEIRLKNAVYPGYETRNERKITSCGFKECLERAAEKSQWSQKKGKLPPGKGIGVAGGWYISGTSYILYPSDRPHSVAMIKVEPEGGIFLYTGACDIGQGSDTALSMIAAEVLGVSIDDVHIVSMDTGSTPMDLGSFSSRVTFGAGNAVKMAAEEVKSRLFEVVSEALEVGTELLEAKDGKIYVTETPAKQISFREAVELFVNKRGLLTGTGSYTPPKQGGKFKGAKVGLSPTYSFSAQVAEVDVDLETGRITVERIIEASDCGYPINPMAIEGQVEGSIQMGLGQAIFEKVVLDKTGKIINDSFLDYRMPSAADMPRVESMIVATNEQDGPFGAKEVGEGAIQPVIPAIANAVFDAIGVRIKDLPISYESVLAQLIAKHPLEAS